MSGELGRSFLLSMLYRNRECVELVKTHMADIRSEATLSLEPDWDALRGPAHDEGNVR